MKLNDTHEKHSELYKNGFLFDADSKTIYSNINNPSIPEDYKDWELEQTDFSQYINDRLSELGIDEKANQIKLKGGVDIDPNKAVVQKVFMANKFGDIEILQYRLNREVLTFKPKGGENSSLSNREQYHYQTRLHPLHAHMCVGKYDFSNAKNIPFWHKSLIENYENLDKVETLTITEGQIKAFKASLDGVPTTGLTSISHFRNRDTGTIHTEICEFIRTCEVQKLVILWDGDCRNISSTTLSEGGDLTKRPKNFYFFASKIRDLLQEFFPARRLKIYFASIKSDELKNSPKGIDDLLIEYANKLDDIIRDYSNIGELPCNYFHWINITGDTGVKKMRRWFGLDTPKNFLTLHGDQIGDNDFVYDGTTYSVENNLPKKKIDADVKNYKRIGTDYYYLRKKRIPIDGLITEEEVLEPWTKQAIIDDHGKDVIRHIERYSGFTNIASHTNYQQVIGDDWNLYYNVDHNPTPGDYPHIKLLLEHLFQEQYNLILDYITILYRKPMQKLPVICLVSRKQKTGKSTFVYLMKLIFKQNMTLISNQDLTEPFNDHWTSKLIAASEETMLEKKEAYERIKSLSTGKTIQRKEKNKSARDIPNMLHFIFCSNHEDDFIRIDDHDSRLWIRKIGTIKQQINHFDEKIADEIPHFVQEIENREIQYQQRGERLYFLPEDFQTDAFRNVVKNSEPTIIKELREHLIDMFIETGAMIQKMSVKDIKNEFGLRFENNYINKMIKQYFKLSLTNSTYQYHKYSPIENQVISTTGKRGRHYTFERNFFLSPEDSKQLPTEEPKQAQQTSILDFNQ